MLVAVETLVNRRYESRSPKVVVERLNRLLVGWANYFTLGQVGRPTPRSTGTPRGGCLGGFVVSTRCGQGRLCASRTRDCGRTTVSRALKGERRTFRGRRHDLVREPSAGNPPAGFDERRLETGLMAWSEAPASRKPPATATPVAYLHRASCRLYKNRAGTLRTHDDRLNRIQKTDAPPTRPARFPPGILLNPRHNSCD